MTRCIDNKQHSDAATRCNNLSSNSTMSNSTLVKGPARECFFHAHHCSGPNNNHNIDHSHRGAVRRRHRRHRQQAHLLTTSSSTRVSTRSFQQEESSRSSSPNSFHQHSQHRRSSEFDIMVNKKFIKQFIYIKLIKEEQFSRRRLQQQ